MKKQNIKKSNKVNILKPTVNKVYGLAISVLLIISMAQGFFIWYMWQFQTMEGSQSMSRILKDAIDGLYDLGKDEVSYEYTIDKVLVPESKLSLPIDSKFSGISAMHIDSKDENGNDIDGVVPEINMTHAAAYSSGYYSFNGSDGIEKIFEKVPVAQSCTRQANILIGEINDSYKDRLEYEYVFSKTLSDGRQIHAYKSSVCTYQADEFLDYLRQIDSY